MDRKGNSLVVPVCDWCGFEGLVLLVCTNKRVKKEVGKSAGPKTLLLSVFNSYTPQ